MIKFLQTFQVNIYVVSTLTTVAIHYEMHVIYRCNTHVFCHNYDNYVLYAKLYLEKDSLVAYFVSRTILAVTDHMQGHISLTFAFSPTLPDLQNP